MQVTRNESWTPTAFHANVVAMEQGRADDRGRRRRLRQLHPVRRLRAALPEHAVHRRLLPVPHPHRRRRQGGARVRRRERRAPAGSGSRWNARTDERTHEPVLGETPVSQEHVRDWSDGLDLPIGGETVLFVDCEAAFYRTSVPRAVAQILQLAGYEFGLMGEQWCCGGPAAEMGYVDQAKRFAQHNLDNWRSTGTKRVLVLDPHDYISLHRGLPEVLRRRLRHRGRARRRAVRRADPRGPADPVGARSSGRSPTTTRAGSTSARASGRSRARSCASIPGLDFTDVDRVTQWSYCSGGGGGLPVEKPELTAAISRRPAREGGGARGRHPGQRLPLVRAAARRGRRRARHRRRRHPRAAGRVARHHGRRLHATASGRHDHRGRAARRAGHRAAHGALADEQILTSKPDRYNRARVPGAVPGAPLGRAAARPRRAADQHRGGRRASSGSPTSCGSRRAARRRHRPHRRRGPAARRHRRRRQADEPDQGARPREPHGHRRHRHQHAQAQRGSSASTG